MSDTRITYFINIERNICPPSKGSFVHVTFKTLVAHQPSMNEKYECRKVQPREEFILPKITDVFSEQ